MFEIKGNEERKCGKSQQPRLSDDDVLLSVTAKPDSRKFRIMVDENRIIICLKNSPENNRANTELVKELQKLLKKEVSLVSGGKAKKKKLLIHNATESEIRSALSRISD